MADDEVKSETAAVPVDPGADEREKTVAFVCSDCRRRMAAGCGARGRFLDDGSYACEHVERVLCDIERPKRPPLIVLPGPGAIA